jgi:hypothetical protein
VDGLNVLIFSQLSLIKIAPHMKKVGELAIPIFSRGIDSLSAAFKNGLGDFTPDERKKFCEDVKMELHNPEYRLEAHMLLSTSQTFC